MQIDFYALNKTSPEEASANIIKKALSQNKNILVRLENEVYANAFDNYLWTFDADAFIPHAQMMGDAKTYEKVLISDNEEFYEKYPFLLIMNNASFNDFEKFERVFWFFNYFDENIVAKTNLLKQKAQALGIKANSWRQNDKGVYIQE